MATKKPHITPWASKIIINIEFKRHATLIRQNLKKDSHLNSAIAGKQAVRQVVRRNYNYQVIAETLLELAVLFTIQD